MPKGKGLLDPKYKLFAYSLWSDDEHVYLANKSTKYVFDKKGFGNITKKYNSISVEFGDPCVEYSSYDNTRGISYYKGEFTAFFHYVFDYDDGANQTCIYITHFGLESFEKATGLVFKEDMARTKPWRVK